MNLLLLTPEYFDSLTTLIVNIFTLLTSATTLYITFLMYKVAIKALSTWKDQKHYDLFIDAQANYDLIENKFSDNLFFLQNSIEPLFIDIKNEIELHNLITEFRNKLISSLVESKFFQILKQLEDIKNDDIKYKELFNRYNNINAVQIDITDACSLIRNWIKNGEKISTSSLLQNKLIQLNRIISDYKLEILIYYNQK